LSEFSEVGVESSTINANRGLSLPLKHSNGWKGKQHTRTEFSSIHQQIAVAERQIEVSRGFQPMESECQTSGSRSDELISRGFQPTESHDYFPLAFGVQMENLIHDLPFASDFEEGKEVCEAMTSPVVEL
jgi:hypothetical protein